MTTPTVSVVMPCRNAASGGGNTLAPAIESIQQQTFEDWELIVVDDGSTDDSAAVVARLAADDARVRLVESEPVGIVSALQQGCARAQGAFIARMDADDIARPQRLAKQLDFLAKSPEVALCGCRVAMTGEVGEGRLRYETWLNRLVSPDDVAREMFVECPIAHPAFFMRQAAFDAVGGYRDQGWPEDYDLCLRMHLAGERLANVPEVLLEWHNTPGRLSMDDPRYSPESFRRAKRHYLFAGPLAEGRPFYQWGAGEVGKRWLREWDERTPQFVVDINPRKVGQSIHGIRVVDPEDVPEPGAAFGIVAVGAPGARDDIRAWFGPRGYRETVDYLFVA
ncbi:MAG: glycosyltransferase [bacterium]|nr:glycosyltransferase [bacterium]